MELTSSRNNNIFYGEFVYEITVELYDMYTVIMPFYRLVILTPRDYLVRATVLPDNCKRVGTRGLGDSAVIGGDSNRRTYYSAIMTM